MFAVVCLCVCLSAVVAALVANKDIYIYMMIMMIMTMTVCSAPFAYTTDKNNGVFKQSIMITISVIFIEFVKTDLDSSLPKRRIWTG